MKRRDSTASRVPSLQHAVCCLPAPPGRADTATHSVPVPVGCVQPSHTGTKARERRPAPHPAERTRRHGRAARARPSGHTGARVRGAPGDRYHGPGCALRLCLCAGVRLRLCVPVCVCACVRLCLCACAPVCVCACARVRLCLCACAPVRLCACVGFRVSVPVPVPAGTSGPCPGARVAVSAWLCLGRVCAPVSLRLCCACACACVRACLPVCLSAFLSLCLPVCVSACLCCVCMSSVYAA